MTAHEAGWDDTGDLEAIHEVLRGGAEREHMRYSTFAFAYSGRALRGETRRGAWIAALDGAGTEPPSWPQVTTRCRGRGAARICAVEPHPPWSAFRGRWLALLERARQVIRTRAPHGCTEAPHDWGSPTLDHARAVRLGLIPVDCGETVNEFWRRPSLAAADAP